MNNCVLFLVELKIYSKFVLSLRSVAGGLVRPRHAAPGMKGRGVLGAGAPCGCCGYRSLGSLGCLCAIGAAELRVYLKGACSREMLVLS